jgi:hypothetical protein
MFLAIMELQGKKTTIDIIRVAHINKIAKKITNKEYLKLCELGAMRIWTLKKKLNNKQNKVSK